MLDAAMIDDEGDHAAVQACAGFNCTDVSSVPSAIFHIFKVLSIDVDTALFPAPSESTHVTPKVCPFST